MCDLINVWQKFIIDQIMNVKIMGYFTYLTKKTKRFSLLLRVWWNESLHKLLLVLYLGINFLKSHLVICIERCKIFIPFNLVITFLGNCQIRNNSKKKKRCKNVFIVIKCWKLKPLNLIIGKWLNDNVVEYYIAIKMLFSEIILIEIEDLKLSRK